MNASTGLDTGVPVDVPTECSILEQDCPRGYKCMPWSSDGSGVWTGGRCVMVADDPAGVGEPCTLLGGATDGLDDCEQGAMCWFVDPKTNIGTCIELCSGSEAEGLECDDPCVGCQANSDVTIALCFPHCDPLASDCPAGQGCYGSFDSFTCWDDDSAPGADVGTPCDQFVECPSGMTCVNGSVVPGCASDSCCTPWCDLDDPPSCPAEPPGLECVPDASAPPRGCSVGSVGICRLP